MSHDARGRLPIAVTIAVACTVIAVALLWPPAARPNVLLVTVDTLRADQLGCYGGTTPTPHLDRLAREGVVFENAACPAPATRPSHFAMFTSRYPRELGEVSNAATLPSGVPTLAEIFRRYGYRTAGFSGVSLLGPQSGITRGFDTFDYPHPRAQRGARAVIERATSWFRRDRRNRPFFLWVHLFDPHMPYQPPLAFVADGPALWSEQLPALTWQRLLTLADQFGGDLPSAALDRIRALYGGEVEKTDMWIGVLLDALRAGNALEHTIVAVTADHGECFEHGVFVEHYSCLYEGAAHVPLIIRYPTAIAAGQRRTDVVEHVDLAPTLLDLARVPAPPTFVGVPLFGAAASSRQFAVLQHPTYPPTWLVGRRMRRRRLQRVGGEAVRPLVLDREQYALRGARWKYVVTGADEELYDLTTDPHELHEVARDSPDVVRQMRTALETWKRRHTAVPITPQPVPPAVAEALHALGYAP